MRFGRLTSYHNYDKLSETGGDIMKIIVEATPEEIAKLVLELQTRQKDKPVNIKLEVGEPEIVKAWGDETEIRLT